MDWKYILSLNFEDLTDEEKDELYTSVTWFELDVEDIDLKKCKTIFKVSQEILKYKGEQVETLFHELEEIAIKQGEDEARKQDSETEARSARSKKSSIIEFENLELKYIELKAKHKKVMRNNEKNEAEIEKLNKTIKNLQQENRRLQNEIQSMPQEFGSESDVSETIRDQQRELVQTVHNKNKQISDLLRDIEEVENENFILRDKLTKVRDELSVATKEITSMTESLETKEAALKEHINKISDMENQVEQLKNENIELQKEKNDIETKYEEFSENTTKEIKQLNDLCANKDREIKELKTKLRKPSLTSSIPSLPKDENDTISHVNALQKALADREKQLADVKDHLQVATKEMEATTEVMKSLKEEKDANNKRLEEMDESLRELKKKLTSVHERCQNLQSEVGFNEKTIAEKDFELKEILEQFKENGKVDLVKQLEKNHQLKTDNRMKEKQIINMVKTTNKLQDACDFLEKENSALREQLGISDDEPVSLSAYASKEKRRRKELDYLKTKFRKLEEQDVELRSELHKLKQVNSSLANQLIELGQKPKHSYSTVDVLLDPTTDRDKKLLAEENKNLVEENEGLRKGMHDILNSINSKKASSVAEIKSETLEKLLRALDVKHISGWYHPAMRLQAEVHNIEGINSELRDQLRKTKIELAKHQSIDDSVADLDIVDTSMKQTPLSQEEDVKKCLENFLEDTVPPNLQQLRIAVREIVAAKEEVEKELKGSEEKVQQLQDNIEILEGKSNLLTGVATDEDSLKKIDEIVKNNVCMKRKVVYLENETKAMRKTIEKLNVDLNQAEVNHVSEIENVKRQNKILETEATILKKLNIVSVSEDQYHDVQKNLDNLTIRYRELGTAFKNQQENKSLELNMLRETQQALESDKEELKTKLAVVSSKLVLQTVQKFDDKVEKLAQSLAQNEVNEMTERQRANHTNNLYQLVKEQLSKSEERFQEYSKYNEDLLKKNLILQEQLKEAEEKIVEFVDRKLYKQLEVDNSTLLKEKEELKLTISKLNEDSKLKEKNVAHQKTWNDNKEQELLNLKHQIVDLISLSDEKVVIVQLNNDIFQCRQSLNYYRTKVKELDEELELLKCRLEETQKECAQEKRTVMETEERLNDKIKNLKNLLDKQKLQYLGCIPLWREETYLNTLKIINKENHEAFLKLHEARVTESEAALLKEQLQLEIDVVKQHKQILNEGINDDRKNFVNWLHEKKSLQINELRYKRQSEFKEKQIEHLMEKMKFQDEQIAKLDEELLLWQRNFDVISSPRESLVLPTPIMVSKPTSPLVNINFHSVSTQTSETVTTSESVPQTTRTSPSSELLVAKEQLAEKQKAINDMKSKISDLEMAVSMFRTQIGDKQSQITFYEKHILDLQNKKIVEVHSSGAGGDNLGVGVMEIPTTNEETQALKATTSSLQEMLKNKETEIMKYQTLLKVDRDRHSLAAASLQEELKNLQTQLIEEKQKNNKLEESFLQSRPSRAAIDQYVGQVHALEKHTAELHTKLSSLEAQLLSSRQETVRWRSLANDRLTAMEDLRRNLEEQHRNELSVYKADSEKFKEFTKDEINNLKQLLGRHKVRCTGRIDVDIQKLVSEKEEKINEMSTRLRQLKNVETKKQTSSESELPPKVVDLESSVDMMAKENEVLKKRCEQLISKEKSAKDEIRDLKSQLMRKPTSIKTDKVDKNIKDQLHKKISTLENEVDGLKTALTEQISINETHKVQAAEDFDKWKKMKHWQQTAERLKNKLKERDGEFEKIQQTSVGYRLLIERLEREKHNLENRIKTLKAANACPDSAKELEILKIENMKLLEDLKNINSKLEIQQHHSGALGAAIMEEKLKSQERKIAILELTSKGTSEVRSEMERLQYAVSILQKNNLRLETENLDLKLDLEKSNKDLSQLKQKIQQLENYIELLNAEQAKPIDSEKTPQATTADAKNVEELERTVFIMKRVVEKLQGENKRLLNGKRPASERATSADKTKRENARLKEQYAESVKKIKQLEHELSSSKAHTKNVALLKKPEEDKIVALADDLAKVKEQLEQKSCLLDKVKILLHRAAAKEKCLLQEISDLKNLKECVISPIPEETESSSDI